MTTLAADALSTTIPPASIKDAGYVAILNYLRVLTPSVAASYLAAGLGVGTIFETAAAESTLGAAQGQRDGQTATTQAQSIGQPPGTILFVNVGDFAATPAQIPAIAAYYQAFRAAASRYTVGAYATSYIINQLAAGPYWQNAMDDNGVSGSVVNPRATMYQRVSPTLIIPGQTGQYDENVIITPLPWWGSSTPPPPPVIVAPPLPIGDTEDMRNYTLNGAQYLSNGLMYRVLTSPADAAAQAAPSGIPITSAMVMGYPMTARDAQATGDNRQVLFP